MEKNKPVNKFSAGSLQVSVWNNTVKNKEGQDFEKLSVTWQKSYKDTEGQWQTTQTLQVNELPVLTMLFDKAFEYAKVRN